MVAHGNAPKDIRVRPHLRWYRGRIVEIASYLKGLTPKMHTLASDLQMSFGFY